jgi:hypothetical protein
MKFTKRESEWKERREQAKQAQRSKLGASAEKQAQRSKLGASAQKQARSKLGARQQRATKAAKSRMDRG